MVTNRSGKFFNVWLLPENITSRQKKRILANGGELIIKGFGDF
jgi:hypothetical protein